MATPPDDSTADRRGDDSTAEGKGDGSAAEVMPKWTLERRRRHYDMRATTSLRLLAAVGGLAVIGAGDLAGQHLGVGPCSRGWCAVPWPATVVSLLLITGALLGLSWSNFSHAARVIEVAIGGDDDKARDEWLKGGKGDPTGAEIVYRTGTVLFVLTGLALIIGFWSTAF
jgi:hypothetical protein